MTSCGDICEISLTWPAAQQIGQVRVSFTTSSTLALPASITVTYWDGRRLVPAEHLQIARAATSNEVTTLTFDQVTTTVIMLTMVSPAPNTAAGFLRIAELQVAPA